MVARKYSKHFGIAFSLLFIVAQQALALNPHRTISQYGHSFWIHENGLPSNSVNTIIQTRDGYICFGTTSGLFCFDGVSFNELRTDSGNSDIHASISALCETRDGSLWVGTQFEGLCRLKDGRIYRYGKAEGFSSLQINALLEMRDGRFLAGTSNGLFIFENRKFKPILVDPNYVRCIAEDSVGRIWAGTYEGIRIFDPATLQQTQSLTTANGLPFNLVNFIYTDREANVWIGTWQGLVCWKNGKLTTINSDSVLPHHNINAIMEDREGSLWVGTRGGLSRFRRGQWISYTSTDGLTDNNALSIAEDKEGSIWVGTENGLNQFKDVGITTFTKSDGLADNHITSVVETPDGSLYFFSNRGESVTCLHNGKRPIYKTWVGPVYLAHDGSLWMGQSGLFVHFRNGKMVRYDSLEGLPNKWISAICEDKTSIFLYFDHTGIFRFINGRLRPYLLANGKPFPTPQEFITCFYQESDTILWVGTTDSLVKVQKGRITGYTTAEGLAGNWITSMFEDKRGNLWIGSAQGGLTLYRAGKFIPFSTKAGLFNDEIYCVLGDNYGDLWLSSPDGIGRVSVQELEAYADGKTSRIHSKVYTTNDGMKTEQCFGNWQPAGWKTRDGHIWFATQNGAVMIDPNGFMKNEVAPPIRIERVVVDQMPMPSKSFAVLPARTDKLEFDYVALSFLAPQRVFFKYKLVGYDRDWIDAGTRREAYYTNLPPGNYTFQVIACNNDGVWNTTGASFSFELKPHFYETYWFYVLIFILISGVIFGIYRLRVWQLLKEEKELNARIQEALADIKTLGGLIPICSNCKKIRDDKGYWENLEKYIQSHSDAQFSHGICPDCAAKLYPELLEELEKKKKK